MKLADWIILIFVIVVLVTLWLFREILLLIFTAIVLSVALNSLVRWLQTFGIRRGRAVPLAMGMVFLVGLLFGILVAPAFLSQFQELIELVPKGFQQLLSQLEETLGGLPTVLESLPIQLPEQTIQILQGDLSNVQEWIEGMGPLTQRLTGNLFEFFSNTLTTFLQLLLVMVLTMMFLSDPAAYRRTMVVLFPAFYRDRADQILSKCELALLSWMRGIAINSLFIALLSGTGLTFLGIRFVLAHALLAGLFNFIPNIGPTLSVIFPISVALLDAPWKALAVLILYLVIQNLESYWFSPMVMQRQVSLLPAATLIAQIFFATFFGVVGLVLALPLAVVTKTWIEEAWIADYLNRVRSTRQGEAVALGVADPLGHEPDHHSAQNPVHLSAETDHLDLNSGAPDPSVAEREKWESMENKPVEIGERQEN